MAAELGTRSGTTWHGADDRHPGGESIREVYGRVAAFLDELLQALQAHSIRTLVDIRSFPVSRRMPHFNRENLERSLPAAGIEYVWMKALGGRRKKTLGESPNIVLRNQSFRNYADHMLSDELKNYAAELVAMAERKPTAYMCAERVYFQCHRMLVSDYLVTHAHEVLHIDGTGPVRPHKLMAEARVIEGELIYRGDRLL